MAYAPIINIYDRKDVCGRTDEVEIISNLSRLFTADRVIPVERLLIRRMAAQVPTPETIRHRQKAVLFCPVCDHESSALYGDWLQKGDGRIVCPDCGSNIERRSPLSHPEAGDSR